TNAMTTYNLTRAPYGSFSIEHVSIPSLQNGDVIYQHGLMLQVSDKAEHPYGRDGATVSHCHVELVGEWHDDTVMTRHWIMGTEKERYHLQGNERATVCKVVG